MAKSAFTIDGVAYPDVHVVSLKRKFSVLDRDTTTRTLSGVLVRSVIGTYYNYSVEIDASGASRSSYDSLYEVLSSPKKSHLIVVPYGQQTITFQAYVSNGEDSLSFMGDSYNTWGGLSIDFIAMAPQRR